MGSLGWAYWWTAVILVSATQWIVTLAVTLWRGKEPYAQATERGI